MSKILLNESLQASDKAQLIKQICPNLLDITKEEEKTQLGEIIDIQ